MASDHLENAVVRLLRERPFYGHFLLNLRREEKALGGKPAGITIRNGIPTLAFDPASFACLTAVEQHAVLEHLVKHLLHLHMLRGKGLNRHDWDVACDLAINPSTPGLPDDAVYPAQFKMEDGRAAEEYYAQLVAPFDIGNLEGSGYGNADKESRGAAGAGQEHELPATLDDHDVWSEADSTPLNLAEEMVRAVTRESLRGSDGEIPAEVSWVVSGLLAPSPLPWRQILRQFVGTAGRVGRNSTWMREHRRFGHDTPGCRKRRRLNLLVGIDVSDSTNIVEMREAFGRELVQIARGRDASITVLYANSRIQKVDAFSGTAFRAVRYDGGGFTDLRPVFDYAKIMHPAPAAIIYLTDGVGPAPEQMEWPTLWVLTAKGEKPVPWGIELRLEV
ncbi:MAG TPA: VWA-like domain-containing protein [Geomonas sp.]|nr:VWA-like domain-containing protein [Geomonas sp.]